jgi:EAL domain-containing protein (putative c-di-GMP-specific phosphodiesterase class I)
VAKAGTQQSLKAPAARRVGDRERFLTFALAAAEILVEVSPEGSILFAAGALNSRFGQEPDAWVGRPVRALVALADRGAFDIAFAGLQARDRLPPTSFRVSDATGSVMSFAALRVPDIDRQRLCITIAAMPAAPPELAPSGAFRDLAETSTRNGEAARQIALIELRDGDAPLALDPALAEALRAALAASIAPDAVAGELAEGRFGVIAAEQPDLALIGAKLTEVVEAAGVAAAPAALAMALHNDALTPLQATRALRYALTRFAAGGTDALRSEGFGEGLAGFVRVACDRATTLRRAIADRRFRMAFQPIVGLQDRKPAHWEALVRPEAETEAPLRQPQDFVTFAETVGLSEELDWAVLGSVCVSARLAGGKRLAANISGLSMQSPVFREKLLGLLDTEPLLARRLLIEITETAEIEEEEEAVATVEALRARGVPLCIDDFGAGAAAFRYLRAFRVDYVKIDGLYVAHAARSQKDRAIISSMVELARGVGAKVVAERIETEAEAALMLELGADYGQGYLFGRPGPLPGA